MEVCRTVSVAETDHCDDGDHEAEHHGSDQGGEVGRLRGALSVVGDPNGVSYGGHHKGQQIPDPDEAEAKGDESGDADSESTSEDDSESDDDCASSADDGESSGDSVSDLEGDGDGDGVSNEIDCDCI